MIGKRYLSKITVILMVLVSVFCILAEGYSQTLADLVENEGTAMEYETALFDTDQPIRMNILLDQEEWENLLDNAMSEEYVKCDVEINGTTFYQVAIRTKGNTSLSSIASDPTTDRYSFKMEFDHYVDGQTCFGLDKLVLNNNYADTTNMKEALVYDMFQYLGADASLYNYAEISVNGTYWGVYLALEAVEDSFLLRNYGAENGELYKPENMDMGGGGKDENNAGGGMMNMPTMPDMSNMQGMPDMPNMQSAPDMSNMQGMPDMPNMQSAPDMSNMQGMPDMPNMPGAPDMLQSMQGDPGMQNTGEASTSSNMQASRDMPNPAEIQVSEETAASVSGNLVPEVPNQARTVTSNGQETVDGKEAMQTPPQGENGQMQTPPQGENGQMQIPPQDVNGQMHGGGMSMNSGGSDLNYTDDDLDSYQTIWDGEVTDTKKADHKRVVQALKNISEGTDLESSMDIDNLLKYMAVHVFSENDDSLSGNMAHNYYLYEHNGKLNLIPWDYNLSFGGFSQGGGMDRGGNGNGASAVVNGAIDDAFQATHFFDKLMENETYRDQYHAYLRQLAEEYIQGDGFETFYQRTSASINDLVETDPNAFYTYSEYCTGAETLYRLVKLRGESILGQVDGEIPSTEEGQRADSSSLVDASSIDLKTLGTMNAGGSFAKGMTFPGDAVTGATRNESPAAGSSKEDNMETEALTEAMTEALTEALSEAVSENNGETLKGDSTERSPDHSSEALPESVSETQSNGSPENMTASRFERQFDPQKGFPADEESSLKQGLPMLLLSAAVMLAGLLFAVTYRRKPRNRR